MSRLNLTLDKETVDWIRRHASASKLRQATMARQLLVEAVTHREQVEQRKKLATDYAAGRIDAAEVLRELELRQLDAWADDD